ncbi:MAG TPA: molybdopterin biosynthesis protein [Anaerolineales bacterium]|jgi:putative molybdopterin biosynthesis protein|nr:molybdopterin biosynthesis protein [Anaerolineales bacterium]HQX18137.1 molybdopterin biosynthesis protein [Anaerolineales bacterium]
MSIYLHDIPLPQAQSRFQQALAEADLWRLLGVGTIPLDENALGRVTAEPIWAKVSSPHYHASAMDGFAVRAEETSEAQPSSPIQLSVNSEQSPTQAQYVDTGDPMPGWANAVIPIENTEALGETGRITPAVRGPSSIRIRASVAPWSHVRPLGEDIVATQLVLPVGHVLRPVDLGAIAAAGHHQINVARKPKVAIIPTGTELVPIGSQLEAGDILEYNSLVLAAQIKDMGGEATRYPIVKDDFDLICGQVLEAAQTHDLVLLNAGSSAGAEDFSARVVEKLGILLVHGVAVRPGHPVILGLVHRKSNEESASSLPLVAPRNDTIPIIGVPGYPVSAVLTVDIFVEPIIAKWLGRRQKELPIETATFTRKLVSPAGDDDFVRVVVGKVGGKLLAAPLSRGAGVITSLVQADGLALVPSGAQGIEAGEPIQVRLYRSKSEIEQTIFCIGSHDLTLDLLAQFLSEHDRRLVSANVGSQGGLVALRRGEAHLAGSHLLDPQSGEYNISSIRRYMPGIPVKVVALVGREQGLIVKKGNPKGIIDLRSLTNSQVRFANRQRGAGTRVLLDYHLNSMTIPPESIVGYQQEEYTHLAVAASVASDRADCGLGIAAAAQALDLDFIPLFQERYDLVIPKQFADDDLLSPLFGLVADSPFREAVSRLTGYDVSAMGAIILEDE